MGRQSRQSRRAQERREQHRKQHEKQRALSVQFLAASAAVVAALAIVLFFVMRGNTSASSGGTPTPTATFAQGPVVDGIHCDQGMPAGGYHTHAHLDIYRAGKLVKLSTDTGHFYAHDCLYWLHAHQDYNGLIHMEAPTARHPKLGVYFDVMKQTVPSQVPNLTPGPGQTMKVWVNLKPYHGNIRDIVLYPHTDVTIDFGPPFPKPKRFHYPPGY